MTDPQPISVAEAERNAKASELRWRNAQGAVPAERLRELHGLYLYDQRILATALAVERRWVPVTERLPPEGARFLGRWVAPQGWCDYALCIRRGDNWHNQDNDEDEYRRPEDWMPLPDQPEV